MSIERIHGVYVADTARVLGEVKLSRDVSVWYGAVIRGDVARVTIGAATNVQDNAVVHCDTDAPNTIGENVVIGHGAVVHGRSVGDGSLIGMRATLLGETVIGEGCLVAAGAVVPPGLEAPDGTVVMGVPGRVVRQTTEEEKKYLQWLAPHYVELAELHSGQPGSPRIRPWPGPVISTPADFV